MGNSGVIRALFFDAGNTLLFPRVERILEILASFGHAAGCEHLDAAEQLAKRRLDEWLWPQIRARRLPSKLDHVYWSYYFSALLDGISVPEGKRNELRRRLIAAFGDILLWSRVLPDTSQALRSLREHGYAISVISNSNGAIEEQLNRVGLAQHLDFVLDSAAVGVEKPHPEIFQMALDRAGIRAAEAVFIGDIHSIDVGGAALAGVAGVLLDRVGAYENLDCPRIAALPELEPVLEKRFKTGSLAHRVGIK